MTTHRTLKAIEADAALAHGDEATLVALRAEWRAAAAHDCEAHDGECIEFDHPVRYAPVRIEFAPIGGLYDMG